MKRLITFTLIIFIISASFSVTTSANESSIKYSYHNMKIATTGIALFDSDYGNSTGTDDKNYELTVENGCVSKVGGYNSNIPENGYVISARGERYHKKHANVKIGDYCLIEKEKNTVTFLTEDYDPFYSCTINFDKFNGTRTSNTIVIYNTGDTTGTNVWGSEVTVNNKGYVTAIGGNDSIIPEGGYVISAVGAERIEELEDAAAIGLKVKVDKNKKTITFTYDEESLCAAVKIKLNTAKEMLNNAKRNLLLIDYGAAEKAIDSLNSIYNDLCSAVNENNIPKTVALESTFNDSYSQFKYLVIESPVVEGRAMWLRPAGLTNKEAVANRVREIKEMGYNIICLELLYDSVFICPMPEDGYFIQNPSLNGFDLLEAFITECGKEGIELNGWLSVYRVSYSTSKYYSQSLAAKKPEWLCLSKSGVDYVANEYGNGYFIDPSNAEATEYLLSAYKYILKNYKLDGLQLDYIRYPHQSGEYFGYNENTREAFKQIYGTDPLDISPDGELWDEWIDFRCDFVTDFVKKIADTAKEISPMTTVSCDIAPNLNESRKTHLQDAKKWLEEGIIDIAYPMAYGPAVVPMYAGYTVDACGDNGLAYIGVGDYGADVYINQILESRAASADGIAFFSYSQYIDGDYAQKIKSSVFTAPALSPSYNGKAASEALLDIITSRLTLAKNGGEASVDPLLKELADVSSALKNSTLKDCKTEILSLCEKLENLENEDISNAIKKDIKLLKKVIAISKDEYRNFTEISEEISDTDVSADIISENDFVLPPWSIALIAVLIIILTSAIAVVIKRKKA